MSRRFNIGDRIICTTTGVIGTCIKFYVPTACEEQTMVITDDCRKYHAPTRLWVLVSENEAIGYVNEDTTELLNPYGKYLCKFAENHNMSTSEAAEQAIVKARLDFFNKTGM